MKEQIRRIVADHGGLSVPIDELDDDDDLFAAGLTSFAVVNVLLALEDELEVEVPESMLRKSTFRSVSSMAATFSSVETAVGP